ncbi:MAG: helix-turn-helix domain-containing protein [Clostridia bacterium]|nr:helix-turn-helix domain-containing protein [Clostridia bacterium]
MTNAEILGNKLYDLRKTTGLSQEELADKLGVSRQAISKWERGEALPDTANLIALAKLYNVSLDELVGNDNATKSADDEKKTEDKRQTTYEDENVKIKVDQNGIKVDCKDDDDRVKVDIDENGISVKVGEDEDDDDCEDDVDDGEVYYSYNGQPTNKKRNILRLLHSLPYPIITTIAFLLWGFLGEAFHVSWTLFITIPIYYTLIDCFRLKRVSHFAYPVFITFVYLLIGMQWGLWHPFWILYLTIPLFYPIANAIDKKS